MSDRKMGQNFFAGRENAGKGTTVPNLGDVCRPADPADFVPQSQSESEASRHFDSGDATTFSTRDTNRGK